MANTELSERKVSVATKIQYHVEIEVNHSLTAFDIYDFTGYESLNDDFNYKTVMISEKKYDVSDLLGAEASLILRVNDIKRTIKGYIFNAKSLRRNGKYFMYELKINSWLEYLKHATYCRIYENLTSVDIIKKAISELSKKLHIDFQFNFSLYYKDYPIREYCVQYNESVYDFIFRLMEEDGIYIQIDQNVVNFYDLNISLDLKDDLKATVYNEVSTFSSEINYSSYDYRNVNKDFKANKQALVYDKEEGTYIKDEKINNMIPTDIFVDKMNKLKGNFHKDILNKATIEVNRNMSQG